MERLTDYRYSELVGSAFDALPVGIYRMIQNTHFLTGSDPVSAGLHNYEEANMLRSYRETAHYADPIHQFILPVSLRHPTIVLPTIIQLCGVVHELAHALDYHLGRFYTASPVTSYAKLNRDEAFAEAFTAWLFWGYGEEPVAADKAFFSSLN